MSPAVWAGGGPELPLTSWREGSHIYASSAPLPMTAAQAREAALRLLEHAGAIEAGDPHADKLESLRAWIDCHRNGQCPECDPLTGRAHESYPLTLAEQATEAAIRR